MYKFFMVDYLTSFGDSRLLKEIGVDHPSNWRWIKIGDQDPELVYKKWIDDHRRIIIMKGPLEEYKAYHLHDLIIVLGDEPFTLKRYQGKFAVSFNEKDEVWYTERPQDALVHLVSRKMDLQDDNSYIVK